MFQDFSTNANTILDRNLMSHKFMARRQQCARTVIRLVSTVILAMLVLAIAIIQR
jgi:hypothetical protein